MIQHIYCIFDKKANCFVGQTMFLLTDGLAMRAFSDMANDKSTTIGHHPEDFTLAHLGTYNPVEGIITGNETGPKFIGQALTLVRD